MNRLLTIVALILCVSVINGCAQRKIAQPVSEQKGEIQDIKTSQADEKMDKKAEIGTPRETLGEVITEKQIAKAQPVESKPSVKELQTSIKDIYFDFDKYDIKDESKPVLKELSNILLKNKGIKVIIEGHCDERGTNEYNLGLGERRANAAKEYLISLGIPSNRIEVISYGEEKQVCEEQTEDCWAKNRRAHFVLVEDAR